MEDKNIKINLFLKQLNESNAIAYNSNFLKQSSNYNFRILERTYAETAKLYASLKMKVKNNNCETADCFLENSIIKQLEEAPQISLEFIQNILGELDVTDTANYDVNNDYRYAVANAIMKSRPGFSKTDGYNVSLKLHEDGNQVIIFEGPMFENNPLVINSSALDSILQSDSFLIATTPDINSMMLKLLANVGVFAAESIVNGELSSQAVILDEFILKNSDGSFDYEIIDIGGGKGRNILKFDLDKIKRKTDPFINAEVAGLLQSEQEAIAAWNVYISKGSSVEEDDQMVQNANAASDSWSYEKDLPLSQDKKVLFESKYKEYFMENYIKQFITNKLPTVTEDAAVFDLEEAKKAKAQKFIDDNQL